MGATTTFDMPVPETVRAGPFDQILRLEDYFRGRTRAHGLFVDRFGNLRRQFQVDIDGSVQGDTLTLKEAFAYDDGERQTRTWTIQALGGGRYVGSADDVVGQAWGEAIGNTFHWRYKLDLKIGPGKTWRVGFKDWMHLQDDGVLMNRAQISRWGLKIGDLTIAFRKL